VKWLLSKDGAEVFNVGDGLDDDDIAKPKLLGDVMVERNVNLEDFVDALLQWASDYTAAMVIARRRFAKTKRKSDCLTITLCSANGEHRLKAQVRCGAGPLHVLHSIVRSALPRRGFLSS
jgi:hypothetical protein